MKIYTVYDKEAEEYSQPQAQAHDVAAMRSFTASVNNAQEGNMLNHAPEHFSLWRIGEFHTDTGTLVPEKTKLAEASAVIRKSN